MPVELKNLIDAGYVDGSVALTHLVDMQTALIYAGDYIEAQWWTEAKEQLYAAGNAAVGLAKYLLQDDIWYESLRRDWRDALYYINDNASFIGNGYELTMQKIMDAVWDSTKLETFFFINYIDAMRASIWNVSIQETKLDELYTHFLQ